MRTSIRKLAILMIALCLSVSSSIISFAGEWKQDSKGYWYVNDDGTFVVNDWKQIDNNWYHFGSDGYMQHSGVLSLDGKKYVLMSSGALETNRNYGFGSSDENGIFTFIDIFTIEQEENLYATYCEQFGIDMSALLIFQKIVKEVFSPVL